jgi:hypothetical protein
MVTLVGHTAIATEWGPKFAKSLHIRSINNFSKLLLSPSTKEDDVTAAFTLMDPLLVGQSNYHCHSVHIEKNKHEGGITSLCILAFL